MAPSSKHPLPWRVVTVSAGEGFAVAVIAANGAEVARPGSGETAIFVCRAANAMADLVLEVGRRV